MLFGLAFLLPHLIFYQITTVNQSCKVHDYFVILICITNFAVGAHIFENAFINWCKVKIVKIDNAISSIFFVCMNYIARVSCLQFSYINATLPLVLDLIGQPLLLLDFYAYLLHQLLNQTSYYAALNQTYTGRCNFLISTTYSKHGNFLSVLITVIQAALLYKLHRLHLSDLHKAKCLTASLAFTGTIIIV